MEVSSIIGGMVYVKDGPMLGKFDEITMSEIKNKIQENKATDMIGARRMPGISIEPVDCTFKTSNFNKKFHAMASNPMVVHNLQIRSNLVTSNGTGPNKCKLYKIELRGWFSSAKEPTLKQGEGGACEYKFEAHAVELIIDGETTKKVDIDNYIWEVNGDDILKEFRKNMGI
jgi:P2 family phage contractile tail tube protein